MTNGSDLPAEILDDCLSRILERKATVGDCLRAHPAAGPELRPLLETATRARDFLAPIGLSPEAVMISEARLRRKLRDSETASGPLRAAQPHSGIAAMLRAAAVAVLTILLLGSGVGVVSASAQALPGDALYPAKIGLERINLAVSWTAAGDVDLLSRDSDRRLEEIQSLVRLNRIRDLPAGLRQYEDTLNLLDAALAQLPAASNSLQLNEMQTLLTRHMTILGNLRSVFPLSDQELLDQAISRSQQSQSLIQDLQSGKGPVNTPPGQQKKETQEPGKQGGGSGRPSASEEPSKTHPGPKQNSTTPKPKKKN